MHRVFCATPWELERERQQFHDLIGEFNETAIPQGILFVPVSLINIRDKRPVQYAVDDNIQQCRNYLLVLLDTWGPPERNFETDYAFALDCVNDRESPVRGVSVIAKNVPGKTPAESLPAPQTTFSDMSEFSAAVKALLSTWLAEIVAERQSHAAGA